MTNPEKTADCSSTSAKLRVQRLLDNTLSLESIRAEIQLVVDSGNIGVIRELETRDQIRFLDIVDQAAPAVLVKDTKFVAALGDISSDILLLPTSTGLLQGLEKRGERPLASGPTDVWEGTWSGKPVAFKAFRIFPPEDLQETKKILWKLAPTWKRLTHENVLPFHGIDTSIFQLALVYEWGHNGNIMQYLRSHPDASRPKLLLQVAKGLQYLHSLKIVHGNLKGANVLISESGKARVCDYDLSLIVSNPIFTTAATPGVAGSSRWLAPEIIDLPSKASSESLVASKSADVFAFAMLAVEVFSGNVPFEDMNESAVIHVANGMRPVRPQAAKQLGLTAEMWKFIKKCWNADPNKRPTINEVVGTWGGFVNGNGLSFWSSASRRITPWDNDRSSMPQAPGRRSQFAEPTAAYEGGHEFSMRKKRFCGAF
ncbi:kinase-like protein [Thelephora ganbajun]|uniref:Kinase-like protein n=1 Tax=Thelephora ganbajun TaxID=370292 RepID=A0ACB6ZB20_THEGA|nr:kinase-like protein [Thelephora ganbajun]